jgi:hypothetical protein
MRHSDIFLAAEARFGHAAWSLDVRFAHNRSLRPDPGSNRAPGSTIIRKNNAIRIVFSFIVAGARFERASSGYEPDEIPLL